MSHRTRRWLLPCACATAVLVAPLRAQTAPPADTSSAQAVSQTPPAPVATPSLWNLSDTLRASIGYRQNATVSAVNPIDRAFYRAELETFVIRPVGAHGQFISFLNADVLRYIDPPQNVSGEQQWAGAVEGRWQPLTAVRGTLKAVGFLEDTFLDPSETEGAQQAPTWVRFWGGYAPLAVRVTLPWGFALEPSYQVKRIRFQRGYAGDYDESRPGAQLEWKRSDRFVVSATWYDHFRHYSKLDANASGGRLLPQRLLALEQREGELKVSSTFDARGSWTAAVTAGRLENRDRAYGFLDYDQKRIALDLSWEGAKWRASGGGEARRLDYRHQTVGFGNAATPRVADVFEVNARVERDLTPKWTLFAENRWERNRSNINLEQYRFSYRTDTLLFGIQRTF